jgi:hypothetical protein
MTYYVSVTNSTVYDMQTSNGQPLKGGGGTWSSGLIGDAWVNTLGWGTLNFLDIGHTHVGGDSGGEWGVLVSYQGEEVVGRYDGSPVLSVAISALGAATMVGGGDFTLRQVSLPAFEINLPPQTASAPPGDPGDGGDGSEAELGGAGLGGG